MNLLSAVISTKVTAFLGMLFLFSSFSYGETVKGVSAEGACAIVGMSAEQCQLTALQRARASAIEQAAGVSVSSSTLVTNFTVAADFIKTYSKGFILNERVKWLPLSQYQKDPSTPPIPEYTVRIEADVYIPKPHIKPIGLRVKTNSLIFKNNEKAVIEASTKREAEIAIFNITADDKVAMLFPNEYDRENAVSEGGRLIFPDKNSRTELIMQTLPGHQRDAEAFFIVAMDASHEKKFSEIFNTAEPMAFDNFFKRYSEIADYCEDAIIVYEVVNK